MVLHVVQRALCMHEDAVLPVSGICDAHLCSQAAAAWANGGVLSGRQQVSQGVSSRPHAQDAAMMPQQGGQSGMYGNRGTTGVSGRLGGRPQGPGKCGGGLQPWMTSVSENCNIQGSSAPCSEGLPYL